MSLERFFYDIGVWVNFLCVDFYSLSQKIKLMKNQGVFDKKILRLEFIFVLSYMENEIFI